MQARKSLVLQAFSMSMGTLVSRVLGLIREMLLVALFPRTITDAWTVAFRLPNLFRRLLGEGSLAVSFIPVFMDLIKKDPSPNPKPQAVRFMNGFFTLLLSLLIVITLLGTFFSREILMVLVSGDGYMSIPGKFEITVHLAQIMFCFILLICIFAYYMAILNTFGHFGWPGFAPTLFNIAMIASTLVPKEWGGINGEYLAWGVVAGGVLQMGILIPQLLKIGYLPKLSWDWGSPGIKEVFKSLLPSWVGVGILQMTVLVNTYFASHLGEGSHTWIYAADRVLELPLSLFAVSMGSALLPRLSEFWSLNDKTSFLATTTRSLRQILFVAIPAGVASFVMAEPIVRMLFGRGRFIQHDILMTSSVLKIYSLAIITYAGIRILVVPFYAVKNTWLPATFSAVSLLVHCGLGWFLMQSHGLQGLMISVVATSALNLLLLGTAHFFILGKLELKSLTATIIKAILASMAMCVPLLWIPTEQLWAFTLSVMLGAFVYFASSLILKSEECHAAFNIIVSKLKAPASKR